MFTKKTSQTVLIKRMLSKIFQICQKRFVHLVTNDYIVYYYLVFENEFPVVRSAIKTDKDLHVQLQVYGNPVPLPPRFTQGQNAKLTTISMLENFPNYLLNVISSNRNLLKELQSQQHYYKPYGIFCNFCIVFLLLVS